MAQRLTEALQTRSLARHWSVTGAGRKARETSLLRVALAGACDGTHSGMAAGEIPAASATRARRNCG
jgi:hypothetical protein